MSTSMIGADALKATVALPKIVAETLNLRRNGKLWTAPCPFHAERTPSFHVYSRNYHCFGCGAHGDVFDWLDKQRGLGFRESIEYLGGGSTTERPQSAPAAPTRIAERAPDAAMLQRRELARSIWDESTDPHGTPVETYLTVRGVRLPDADVIRFHARCPREGGTLPAMVALMTEPLTGEFRGVHRTFLRSDGSGKANVEKAKMMLGGAGIVQLVDLEDIGTGLGLAEGIETALSVMQAIGWGPVWAAGTAGSIRTFPYMRATTLNIFSDGDGEDSKQRVPVPSDGLLPVPRVLIHTPPAGRDWNDVAMEMAE